MRNSLIFKLMGAFLLVIAIGALAIRHPDFAGHPQRFQPVYHPQRPGLGAAVGAGPGGLLYSDAELAGSGCGPPVEI